LVYDKCTINVSRNEEAKTKPENHGHREGEEVQAKGMHNIFNKIITEISQI
jgi:hypothetical protein